MKTSSTAPKSSSSSLSANTQRQKIGRPINCFMAFRLEKHRQISSQSPRLNHRAISKIVAKWWKEANEFEKAPYRAIAEEAKAEHAKRYPDYKYKPIKKSQRNTRPYHRREDAITREQKSNEQKQLLKQWLGDQDTEDHKDNKSEASFSSASSSCSSSSSSTVNTIQQQPPYPFFDAKSPSFINQEPMDQYQQDVLCQPVIYYNDFIDHSFAVVPNIYYYNSNISSESQFGSMTTDLSSLESLETPDFVNPQMLSLNNLPLML